MDQLNKPDPLSVLTNSLRSNGRVGSHPAIGGQKGDSTGDYGSEDINTHMTVSKELQTAAGNEAMKLQMYAFILGLKFFLHSFSGDLGKELKNLITLMDQEEAEEAKAKQINLSKKVDKSWDNVNRRAMWMKYHIIVKIIVISSSTVTRTWKKNVDYVLV